MHKHYVWRCLLAGTSSQDVGSCRELRKSLGVCCPMDVGQYACQFPDLSMLGVTADPSVRTGWGNTSGYILVLSGQKHGSVLCTGSGYNAFPCKGVRRCSVLQQEY